MPSTSPVSSWDSLFFYLPCMRRAQCWDATNLRRSHSRRRRRGHPICFASFLVCCKDGVKGIAITGPPFGSIDKLHGCGPGLARISFYSHDDDDRGGHPRAACHQHLKTRASASAVGVRVGRCPHDADGHICINATEVSLQILPLPGPWSWCSPMEGRRKGSEVPHRPKFHARGGRTPSKQEIPWAYPIPLLAACCPTVSDHDKTALHFVATTRGQTAKPNWACETRHSGLAVAFFLCHAA